MSERCQICDEPKSICQCDPSVLLLSYGELAEQRRELLEALKNEVSKQNCICKFLPFTGGASPCDTCKLNDVIARTEGR